MKTKIAWALAGAVALAGAYFSINEIKSVVWVNSSVSAGKDPADQSEPEGKLRAAAGIVAKATEDPMGELRAKAEQGIASAQFNLGAKYANGDGVPKDNAEAMKWYFKAALQGDASAQFNLGLIYSNGEGVPKDGIEALMWYRMAAEQGYLSAQTKLGWMYATGDEVPKDSVEAVKWYRKAADQGNCQRPPAFDPLSPV